MRNKSCENQWFHLGKESFPLGRHRFLEINIFFENRRFRLKERRFLSKKQRFPLKRWKILFRKRKNHMKKRWFLLIIPRFLVNISKVYFEETNSFRGKYVIQKKDFNFENKDFLNKTRFLWNHENSTIFTSRNQTSWFSGAT